jgi:MFS family permease
MSDLLEKKENRGYLVWSIIIGGLFGFLITIFSNLYYELFIVKRLSWSSVDHTQFIFCALLLIALVGYLQFFIDDYPNTFEFTKKYWKRFSSYFFYKFSIGKVLRVFVGIYLLLFVFGFMILLYVFLIHLVGFLWGTLIAVLGLIAGYLKDKNKKNIL